MAWPIKTWVANAVLPASELNSYVRDPLTDLRAGGIEMASQAANDLMIATGASQFARLPMRAAFVTVTAGAPALTYGLGVSSITDNGPGDFTVNFSVALPSVNYVAVTSAIGTGNTSVSSIHSKATGSVRVLVMGTNFGTPADSSFSVICLGG